MKLILEGISYNEETKTFDFDWKSDKVGDLVNLKLQTYNKVKSVKRGVQLYYAYKFNQDIPKDLKALFRDSIKYVQTPSVSLNDVDILLSKSVTNFNQIDPLSSFDVIVTPKSTSKILDLLKQKLSAKAGGNTLLASDLFVKNTLDNIKLDQDKLNKLTPQNREKALSILNKVLSKEDFKLKSVPPQYREFISNFLSFNTDTEKRIFNSIVSGKVLLVDDILTKGTTLLNMAELLVNLGADSITGFVLLANA